MKKMLLLCAVVCLFAGCRSVELRPEEVCGTYRLYSLDRDGREVPFEKIYFIFLPDGTYRSEIREKYQTEEGHGKWRIDGSGVELQGEEAGQIIRYRCDPDSGKLSCTMHNEEFFPRGLTLVLKRERGTR